MTRVLAISLVLLGLGCSSSGAPGTLGYDEPLRVKTRVRGELVDAQFHSGPLPGSEPLQGGVPEGGLPESAYVTGAELKGTFFRPGQAEIDLSGRATVKSYSVAVKFDGLGSGYWVIPVLGAEQFPQGEEQLWAAELEFSSRLPPGVQRLALAALDGQGHSGPQRLERLCVSPRVPDNLNACDPTLAPPSLVLSLEWDRDVDLDLRVLTPDGKVVEPKHPTTALKADGSVPDAALEDPSAGIIDSDSNRSCVIDGHRLENLVWKEKPKPGRYGVWVNLFDGCGQDSVRFTLSAFARESLPDSLFGQRRDVLKSGILLALDANGGTKPGLFVTELDFN
jgi:hypothetical protein